MAARRNWIPVLLLYGSFSISKLYNECCQSSLTKEVSSMAVPKCKVSSARRDKRRGSNWKLAAPTVAVCPKCGEPVMPHRACKACGNYNGRQVLAAKAD